MKLGAMMSDAFKASLKKLSDQNLPIKTAYAIKGINIRIKEELNKYEQVRTDAINRLALKHEDGKLNLDENNNASFTPENRDLFVDQLNELLNIDIDIGSISIDDLGNVNMTANELMTLDTLIK